MNTLEMWLADLKKIDQKSIVIDQLIEILEKEIQTNDKPFTFIQEFSVRCVCCPPGNEREETENVELRIFKTNNNFLTGYFLHRCHFCGELLGVSVTAKTFEDLNELCEKQRFASFLRSA